MAPSTPIILITGATGDQGGATARALAGGEYQLRALVRNPSSDAAFKLKKLGVSLFQGDFDDFNAISRAMACATGLFMNVSPSFEPGSEVRQAKSLLKAASVAGTVTHIVYSSVTMAGQHETFPEWGPDHPMYEYWVSKHQIECAVRESGIKHWTILRPAFFMGNYLLPKATHMFPHLILEHALVSIYMPDLKMVLIDESDIGKFAAAALRDPGKFAGMEISLGTEALTTGEIAAVLSKVSGKYVKHEIVGFDEAVKKGIYAPVLQSQEWANDVGYQVDFKALENFEIIRTTFSGYLERERDRVRKTIG